MTETRILPKLSNYQLSVVVTDSVLDLWIEIKEK